jgi:hypothetical protein
MLEYQERLKKKKERNNVETILKANGIPSNNQITRLLDGIAPGTLAEAFGVGLETAQQSGSLPGIEQPLPAGNP